MRFISIVLAVLMIAGSAYAVNQPQTPNAVYIDGHRASTQMPSTEVRIVRYARGPAGPEQNESGLSSGDVVMWDRISLDGVTVSMCVVVTGTPNVPCGVLVTDIATTDSGAFSEGGTNWGYMAVRGYCLAQVDTSAAVAGSSLQAATAEEEEGKFKTGDWVDAAVLSTDCGVLLQDTGADGLMPVMLNNL